MSAVCGSSESAQISCADVPSKMVKEHEECAIQGVKKVKVEDLHCRAHTAEIDNESCGSLGKCLVHRCSRSVYTGPAQLRCCCNFTTSILLLICEEVSFQTDQAHEYDSGLMSNIILSCSRKAIRGCASPFAPIRLRLMACLDFSCGRAVDRSLSNKLQDIPPYTFIVEFGLAIQVEEWTRDVPQTHLMVLFASFSSVRCTRYLQLDPWNL